ncbi:MAG: response regulator [Anaerolineae bacterium]|nr:response regulator [Anaerolineae bacterium]
MKDCRVLVIEDEPANRDFLVRLVTQAGFEASGARDGSSALEALEGGPCAVVIVDIQLPDISGLDLVRTMHERYPDAIIVVASMWDEPGIIGDAFEAGCSVFLVKPHGFMELYQRLKLWPEQKDQLHNLLIDQYGPRPYRHDVMPAAD